MRRSPMCSYALSRDGDLGIVGDALDTALAESINATLETGLLNRQVSDTHQQLSNALLEHIEVFYNRQSLHSALGYLSPAEFERKWASEQDVKSESAA